MIDLIKALDKALTVVFIILLFIMMIVATIEEVNSATFTTEQIYTSPTNLTIDGDTFSNTSGNCLTINNGTNVTVKNSTFNNCDGNSIGISRGDGYTLTNNTFFNVKAGIRANAGTGTLTNIKANNNWCKRISLGTGLSTNCIQFNKASGPGNEIIGNVVTMDRNGLRLTNSGTIYRPNNDGDAISLYDSQGTSASPIKVHRNIIYGRWRLTEAQITSMGTIRRFAGAAIQAGDGPPDLSGAWQDIRDNVVINAATVGIAMSGGTDQNVINNLVYMPETQMQWGGWGILGQDIRPADAAPCARVTLNYNRAVRIDYIGAHSEMTLQGSCSASSETGNSLSHFSTGSYGSQTAYNPSDTSWKSLEENRTLRCVDNVNGHPIWLLNMWMKPNSAVTKEGSLVGDFTDINEEPDLFSTNNTTDNDNTWITDAPAAGNHSLTIPLTNPPDLLLPATDAQKVKVLSRLNATGGGTGNPQLEVTILDGVTTIAGPFTSTITSTSGKITAYDFTWPITSAPANMKVKVRTIPTGGASGRVLDYGSVRVYGELNSGAKYRLTNALDPLTGASCQTDYGVPSTTLTATLTATPTTVTEGNATVLTWTSTGAIFCAGTNFNTDGAAVNSVGVSSTPGSDTTYTLLCSDGTDEVSDAKTVTVTPASPPVSADLITNKTLITVGESATLTWTSVSATSCTGTNFSTADAIENLTGVIVTPVVDTTYTLTCTDGVTNAQDTVTITVNPANPPPPPPDVTPPTVPPIGLEVPPCLSKIILPGA